jgi:hypothetical protein
MIYTGLKEFRKAFDFFKLVCRAARLVILSLS